MTDMPQEPIAVTVSGLVLLRDGQDVIAQLTLNLVERRIALIGRNGSGKSTLIRALAGLVAPDAGEVRLDGVDPLRDRQAALRLVGILFQNPDHQIIFPTVREELGFGLRQQRHPDPEAATLAMLDRFGRRDWADRAVATLSQGQRHLVCLMSILAMQPRLLLLDEPMAGLDLPTITALDRHLAGLPQSVIHATHDLDLVSGYDRVIWIEGGRLAGDGPPSKVIPAYRRAMTDAGDAFADLPH